MLQLLPHQVAGIEFLQDHPRAILADEMGLGKTAQAILASKESGATQILVVCLKSLKRNWADEIKLWWPEATIRIIYGTQKQREDQWTDDVNFHIASYETMLRDMALLTYDWHVMICDEAHKFLRHRSTKTYRCIKEIARFCRRCYLLTGTPIVTEPKDLWSMLNILDHYTFRSYWKFVRAHCNVSYNGFGYSIEGALNCDYTAEVLSPWLIRRTKVTAGLKMPLKQFTTVWVNLNSRQRKHYDEMFKYCWTHFPETDEHITVVNIVSQILRLRQITISPDLIQEDSQKLTGAKIDALLDLLSSAEGTPVVIFSQFKEALLRLKPILEKAHYKPFLYTGGMTEIERDEVLKAFQACPNGQLLCVTSAGGIGLNMTNAHIAIFLDKDWAPANNVQAQDRLHRLGQNENVMIYELLTRNTIEEALEHLLDRRMFDTNQILTHKALQQILEYAQELTQTTHEIPENE